MSVTDGNPVNWESAGRDVSPSDRSALERLRDLEGLARLHANVSSFDAVVHDSIRSSVQENAETPLKWGTLEILEKIGRGAYGDVYRARDPRLGRDVALKLLRHRDSPEADVVREGHLLARVRHPNVVTVYGAERIDGRTGLWMELLRGETLEQELRRRGSFSAEDLVRVATDLCNAIEAVHTAGMLHRDIKAQNVIRAEDGRLVLMDFGTGSEGEGPSLLAGTPAYLAPEVLAGAQPTVASEMYALGVLLFHLATGAFPVDGSDIPSLGRAHQESRPKSLAVMRPDFPRRISAAVDRTLARDPSVRYSNVAEFRKSLLPLPSQRRLNSRRITVTAAAITAAVLGVAVLLNRDFVRRRRAVSEPVSLSQIPASIQRRFHIRAPSWEGSLATCTPYGPGAVSLCDLTDGSIRAVRTPASDRERSTLAYLSPDGQLIAYIWVVDPMLVSLRLIHADGSNDRELLSASEPMVSLLGWNRASNAILVMTAAGNGACTELLEVETGARQKLRCVTDRTSVGYSTLSPDDRFLAYTKPRSTGRPAEDLWILDRVSKTDRPVTADVAMDRSPIWTPDGRALTFVSDRLGTWGLFLINIENGVPQGSPELVRDLGRSMPTLLGFRREGTLFLSTMTDLEDVLRTELDLSALSLGSPGRAEPTALDESNRSPDWSPDGKRFAYIAGSWRGEARIVVARAQGGVEKPLSFPGMPSVLGKVRWSPDGRMLAVTAGLPEREPTSRLDLVELDTGQRRSLLTTRLIVDMRWAPDGKSIYFLSTGAIWSVDLTSAIPHEVYRPEKPWMIDRFATFDLSRDGTAFLVAIRSPGVIHCAAQIITTAGDVRDLPPFTSECRAIAWTHDEQAVLAGVHVDDGSIPVFTVPVQGGGEPVRLQSPRIQVVDISVSPDGRELLLGSGNPRPDVWTLSGFTSGVR